MKLNKLLTCSKEELNENIDFIDGACNGIALINSLIDYQKELDNTDDRNQSAVTGYILQKLCALNHISNETLYRDAYHNLLKARGEII